MTALVLCLAALSGYGQTRSHFRQQWDPNTAHRQHDTLNVSPGMVREQFVLTYVLNETELREDYMRNKLSFRRIREALANSQQIDSITIYAYASPEGPTALNYRLSVERARTAREFIIANLPQGSALDTNNIVMHPMGENWEGLTADIIANYHRPNRQTVLDIIHDPRFDNGAREWRIKQLDSRETWNYLLDNYMPALRTASWVCVWMKEIPPVVAAIDFCAPAAAEQAPAANLAGYPEMPAPRAPWLALKTNLLSDALLLPDLGAEVCLGNRMSLQGNWTYAWWINDPKHIYWSGYGGDASLRFWLGRRTEYNRLCGHHIGLYGQMFTYDFELGRGGLQTAEWAYAAGLEYGCSKPVGKNLNIDFSIGAGLLKGETKAYLPIDTHYVWQATYQFPRFCVTKAEISLVWVLGRSRYRQQRRDYDRWQAIHRANGQKGGAR